VSENKERNDKIIKRIVAHYIPDLGIGGAERQLIELAKGIDKAMWDTLILTNYINPSLKEELQTTEDIRIVILNKKSKLLYPQQLLMILYREKPHLINAYLLGAQLYTLLVSPFLPKMKVVFSVRDATDYKVYHGFKGKWFRFLVEKSAALVDCYIFNSDAGRKERNGIPDSKVFVIPNGIDTVRFRTDDSARNSMRKELRVGDDVPVVGIVANFSIYKGYDTFIHAAQIVSSHVPDARFVSIGNYDTALGKSMRKLVSELGLTESFHFMGARQDVQRLLPGFDVFCSSSVTEGFSNAICEGMACGVPCVVTDVGDSAVIIGDTGVVVPPQDPTSLAAGIMKLLQLPQEERQRLGVDARLRIEANFSIPRMVTATEKVYYQLLESH